MGCARVDRAASSRARCTLATSATTRGNCAMPSPHCQRSLHCLRPRRAPTRPRIRYFTATPTVVFQVGGQGVADTMMAWGDALLLLGGKKRPLPGSDLATSALGYWTDNVSDAMSTVLSPTVDGQCEWRCSTV